MKVFTFKPKGNPCPICGTEQEEDAILVRVRNNREPDANNLRAAQVHIHCLASTLSIFPWDDGRTIIVGDHSLKHFNRKDYGITY